MMASEDTFSTTIGSIICVGIVATFIPQFHKIVSSKSSYGISHYFLFIGLISSATSFLNAVIFYYDVILACYDDSNECMKDLLALLQIGIQFICMIIYYVLLLMYLPTDNRYLYIELDPPTFSIRRKEYLLFFGDVCIVAIMATITFCLLLETQCDELRGEACFVWAKTLGYISLAAVLTQFIPQMYRIYKNKSTGSISLITLCMQVAGNVLWTTFLIKDPEADFTTWLSFLVATTFQFLTLILCVYYEVKKKRSLVVNSNVLINSGTYEEYGVIG
jgi:uncharacterized protein with PQ loop repeat